MNASTSSATATANATANATTVVAAVSALVTVFNSGVVKNQNVFSFLRNSIICKLSAVGVAIAVVGAIDADVSVATHIDLI